MLILNELFQFYKTKKAQHHLNFKMLQSSDVDNYTACI